jgi:hypothetical protein
MPQSWIYEFGYRLRDRYMYKVYVNGFSLSCDIFFMDAEKRMRKKQKRQEKRTDREAWNMAKHKSCYFVCMS